MLNFTNEKKRETLINTAMLLSIAFTILLQSFAIVWWASSLSTRVNVLEAWVRDNRALPTMIHRMEERFDHLKGSVERLVRLIEIQGSVDDDA